MKYLLSLTLLLFLSISAHAQHGIKIENELIEISFNSTMTISDLVYIHSKSLEKDINLNYEEITFYENGTLSSISFKVDCNDGFSGSASGKLLTKKSRVGFQRDYTKNAKIPFRTGALNKNMEG